MTQAELDRLNRYLASANEAAARAGIMLKKLASSSEKKAINAVIFNIGQIEDAINDPALYEITPDEEA